MKILRRTPTPPPPPPPPAPGMMARRRVEITVERETQVSGPPPSFEAHCTQCGRRVVMVDPSSAALVAQVSIREIYRWVDANKLHFLEAASGELYLCATSVQASTPNASSAETTSPNSTTLIRACSTPSTSANPTFASAPASPCASVPAEPAYPGAASNSACAPLRLPRTPSS